jgi:hypothetical protein
MNIDSKAAAWTLIGVSLLLLVAMGKLDLLVVLVPVSLLLGYGLLWLGRNKTGLTRVIKKG